MRRSPRRRERIAGVLLGDELAKPVHRRGARTSRPAPHAHGLARPMNQQGTPADRPDEPTRRAAKPASRRAKPIDWQAKPMPPLDWPTRRPAKPMPPLDWPTRPRAKSMSPLDWPTRPRVKPMSPPAAPPRPRAQPMSPPAAPTRPRARPRRRVRARGRADASARAAESSRRLARHSAHMRFPRPDRSWEDVGPRSLTDLTTGGHCNDVRWIRWSGLSGLVLSCGRSALSVDDTGGPGPRGPGATTDGAADTLGK